MITSYENGHIITYIEKDKIWVYKDTYESVDNNPSRPCAKCGKLPTPEGYDACLGHIEGVIHACCGHGKHNGYKILIDGTKIDLGLVE